MICEICGADKGKRVISGIHMCEDCFTKISNLRRGDESAYYFFSDPQNSSHASESAKTYIKSFVEQQHETIVKKQLEHEEERKNAEIEQGKREYARTVRGLYEYDVVTILNKGHGRIDRDKMLEILSSRACDGWKLHTIYSNELGKNALALLGFAINETACEDVLIFERKLKD